MKTKYVVIIIGVAAALAVAIILFPRLFPNRLTTPNVSLLTGKLTTTGKIAAAIESKAHTGVGHF